MCALIDDPLVECWRSGRGTTYRHVLRTRSGRVLDLNPLKGYTTAPKMNAEIASQLETEPEIKSAQMSRFISLLSRACELRQEITADDRVRNLMVAFLDGAPTHPVRMDDDQKSRVAAFRELRRHYPVATARAEGVDIPEKALVLHDETTGKRYVKQAWFHAYLKAHLGPSTVDDAQARIGFLGWTWRGRHGRIKATPTDGGKDLIEIFYEVPRGWED